MQGPLLTLCAEGGGGRGWARHGTCIVHFHTLLSKGPLESLAFGREKWMEREGQRNTEGGRVMG